jgi:tetratricopeptide (TPR) repeat protein
MMPSSERTDFTGELLNQLREDVAYRRIESGMRRLDEHRALLEAFDPSAKNAASFLGYLAQWVDIGYGSPELVRTLLAAFPKTVRSKLSVGEYVHLRMAEGVLAMAEEEPDEAIGHFDFVLGFEDEVDDKEVFAIANFWKGRCHRKKGEYDDALKFTIKGRDLALRLGYERMAAIMQVLESWLCFQKGKSKEAVKILGESEGILRDTDDYVTLGNIYSAYGRIAQREARYEQAVGHFLRAIDEYKKRGPQHQNLARSLANLAYSERLIALQLSRRIDAEVARRRTGGAHGSVQTLPSRERLDQIRADSFVHLDQASEIYAQHPHHHGAGTVHVNRGLLFLDAGEWDRAGVEASEAFRLGQEKHDYILMARARLLQCIVENAKLDEQVEEHADPGRHAQAAQEFSSEAVQFARHTQNQRVLARAYIWRGLTMANDFFHNPAAATECCDLAAAALKSEPHDELWEELQILKTRILGSANIDSTLRSWSQGEVGNKTFQQITDEFAEIIIPKVWEREDRRISRVATRLSISPKKVRRILKAAGLLNNRS